MHITTYLSISLLCFFLLLERKNRSNTIAITSIAMMTPTLTITPIRFELFDAPIIPTERYIAMKKDNMAV